MADLSEFKSGKIVRAWMAGASLTKTSDLFGAVKKYSLKSKDGI